MLGTGARFTTDTDGEGPGGGSEMPPALCVFLHSIFAPENLGVPGSDLLKMQEVDERSGSGGRSKFGPFSMIGQMSGFDRFPHLKCEYLAGSA